jgi:hypothetical protein
MNYEKDQIIFVMGHWFRVKEVTGPESCTLDLLTLEEARSHEANLIRKYQAEEEAKQKELFPVYTLRLRYKTGDMSREFTSIGKIRKFAKRKQGVESIVTCRNGKFNEVFEEV